MATKEEQIRKVIDNMDSATVKDALAILIAERNGQKHNDTVEISKPQINQEFTNFAQAIVYLRKKYKFAELERFSTEADLVYVNAGDRKILITDQERNLREMQEQRRKILEQERAEREDGLAEESHADRNTIPTESEASDSDDETGDAFEPVHKNGRFNNLEF